MKLQVRNCELFEELFCKFQTIKNITKFYSKKTYCCILLSGKITEIKSRNNFHFQQLHF
jgi:hypothetical protein